LNQIRLAVHISFLGEGGVGSSGVNGNLGISLTSLCGILLKTSEKSGKYLGAFLDYIYY
jgi:hypothetical protein